MSDSNDDDKEGKKDEHFDIIPTSDSIEGIPGRVSSLSYLLPVGMSFEDWSRVGETLRGISKGINWWIGDWLNYGERQFGEMYSQAVLLTGRDESNLATLKWVASVFPPSKRREGLSFQHHVEVCALMNVAPKLAEEILDLAEEIGMSSKKVREDARQALDELYANTSEQLEPKEALFSAQYASGERTQYEHEDVTDNGHVEWLDELLEIVLALVDAGGLLSEMTEVRKRTVEWAYTKGLRGREGDKLT